MTPPVARRTALVEPALDPTVDRTGGRRGREAVAWVLPPLVMAALGAWALSRGYGLWYDELYTAEVARLPLDELFSAIVHGEGPIPYLRDAPPSYNGPYYAVVHLWLAVTRLQPDEWGLRLLSLVAAVAAVTMLTAAVRRLAGPTAALAAGLVVATNPFVVQFAAEGRGYTLALLGIVVAALGLSRSLDGLPRSVPIYGVSAAAAGLAHWFALLVIGAFAAAAVVLRRRRAVPLVVASAVAAIPALALVGTAIANGVGASGAEWLRGVGADVPRLLLRSWSGRNAALLVLTVVMAAAGLLVGGRDRREARVVAAAWLAAPVAAVTMLELVRPVFVDRYLLPAVLGLAVLVALGVARLPRRLAVVALTAVLAASLWATLVDVGRGPKEDVRGAVDYVAAHHRPGEPVVAPTRWDALGLDHFARRDHPELAPDVVLAPTSLPLSPTLWVIRRVTGGVKGDATKVEAVEAELAGRRMALGEEHRFDGRYTDTLVQRWVPAP